MIEIDLAEVKQALRKLQRQFRNQFAPAVSVEDQTTLQQSIIEQSSLERIAKCILHEQNWKTRCKEVLQGQSLPLLVNLSDYVLKVKRLHLKTLDRTVKNDIINKDYLTVSKNGRISQRKQRILHDAFGEVGKECFKSDNQMHKRRMAEKNKTQQDLSDYLLSSPDMSETGYVELSIIADVLSASLTASVELACKRSRRS
ncbi:hypothetical protein PHYBLDRAFT_170404 [Phycomyces blakesleeanus NRRL 1555(-)]|uniref:Uncharacterized protein n=1 Tax=Phycomyces blakesleeanus (strain ATCC 8743b / DSM 1359 / FGSC 10004 / NBRC 33097 / NRRL 1555) TaxID=763407 RepID=A0A162U271_PHYB8|nr:hypothetical protein PHYBLDRAFT_170404 [Phycomyces blakesleeanus NRRL 1555(-)]OAD71743.1 hypothetical protein PHYBLDRAFT_170404 [Phycomyces blakesleeanus NRRL 1555(-)]|eukprot:XP_018289783.1 hypothetical protein PHYBLDRAFT_170404 [Phycomyces blakesleeanus NRRL 1555(-)]